MDHKRPGLKQGGTCGRLVTILLSPLFEPCILKRKKENKKQKDVSVPEAKALLSSFSFHDDQLSFGMFCLLGTSMRLSGGCVLTVQNEKSKIFVLLKPGVSLIYHEAGKYNRYFIHFFPPRTVGI